MNYEFPKGFWWGSAASATQTEGNFAQDGKAQNIWDFWYAQHPEKFFNQVGPDTTSAFYEKYQEDIQLMKKTGHTSFRTSIQWSRLIPDNQTRKVNPRAVDFYNHVIDGLIANDIEPFLNLYHFDMPMELQKKGGWLNREVVDAYVHYAKTCFELFGDRVNKWFTHNEPIVPVEGGYLYGWHYPDERNLKHGIQVAYHEILSSAKAIEVYHNMKLPGEIGIILNLTPTYPRNPKDQEDVKAAKLVDGLFNRSFLDASVKGSFPTIICNWLAENDLMPQTMTEDIQAISNNTVDLLGINYYQPRRVKKKESVIEKHQEGILPEDFYDDYDLPGKKINPYSGWEIYEKGIYDILSDLRENYKNIRCYISENGMGFEDEIRFKNDEGIIEDDYRIEFITNHLKWVHQAIQEGSNVQGYHMWTCMDNWSWLNAYKNRYGFISVDLKNAQKRTIKKSGYWFKKTADNNGFD
ncbi:6-phospho-beta-glucosidase GmuD [Melissococcus plutonius]|uniref:Beta-glucosidase n=1 Tax=Melissococcus plutonius (strain ATCC 35311 / DSM 29964 / CIP 104052 / LMG 20360 / NCIMB 702443) TaxID=940190 RepID=F3Y9S9_MELPT|nr:glycoside hydrolase family 1 protein [Melissococcus plutonius]AIM24789.1 6-phospho-beta-glucosidase GmuD [Melissococcus plutonius S1]KMT24906.1 6-phospho-beta-glucosidase GmuD [Melissococcus plutonius]KMT26543.1 6-phospho-beta-glucosidase GmuD [Melissococcus plutonius]KMT27793.1 6-phospho-beta-glucosidase GmuD [Melissococcus plutonius]KMT29565.1 6-phospho-beta-glucosidase GmuD [Melissococcus plutonius]